MKKILLFSILICFVFSSRYQYDTSSTNKNKKKYNKKKYSYIGVKKDKEEKRLYTMWGLGIPGHNNGFWEYESGYNLLGFYFNNGPISNSLHGFNISLINYNNKYKHYYDEFSWYDLSAISENTFIAYSMIIFPDFRTNQEQIEDRLYIRADIGVNNYNSKGRAKYYDNGELLYLYTSSFSDATLGGLVGIGYKLDLNDYLKTKKDTPYIMFEITTHFDDILDRVEGFIENFAEEPGDLFDLFEGYFLKGNWNLTVSVMADITKK